MDGGSDNDKVILGELGKLSLSSRACREQVYSHDCSSS